MNKKDTKRVVKEGYARIAKEQSCCSFACCQSNGVEYSNDDLRLLPASVFSLGCGSPLVYASLRKGETVLDLGSGSGLECFLASTRVGESGRVIGVDMVPEMIKVAKTNAEKGGYKNVEFILGDIENLPLSECSIDAVISNCVINLAPNKRRVFEEIYRVLNSSGRLVISDIVLLSELPPSVKEREDFYIGCVSGAMLKDDYINLIKQSGFKDVETVAETTFPLEQLSANTAEKLVKIASVTLQALKPQ
ncbi:MAG: arsenite methyltransferase [Nitrososphaerales archaeon]